MVPGPDDWLHDPREPEPAASPYADGPGSGEPPRRPGRGGLGRGARIAIVAATVAAGAGALWLSRSPRDPAVAGSVPGGQVLAPVAGERDATTGEEVVAFQGFAVSVETEPPGALVTVDGVPRGEAPAFAGVDCSPGEAVEVQAEARGRAPVHVRTACRRDALVKLRLRLPPRRP
ncbi:MAG TPA: hypothetical protein VLS93_11670 [Anaeromyxobacteraceae bacterium]|nr:hypothetical protein [Anaeromyxobacteraceae bacterium]